MREEYLEREIESDDVDVDVDVFEYLYDAVMENEFDRVVSIFKRSMIVHAIRLTRSGDTALHVAVSTYDPERSSPHDKAIMEEMILVMKKSDTLYRVLATQNERGDTPLHVAAAVGWLRIFDSLKEVDLSHLHIRNEKGETPLFVAALHCNLDVLRRLLSMFKPEDHLLRCKDGNTILHKAIFQENFELAYMIIDHYPMLLKYINEDGESPLHVLAKKPNVFKSSSHLGFCGSVIYHWVTVEKLSEMVTNERHYSSRVAFPENYTTCVNIFALLRSLIVIIRDSIFVIFKTRPNRGTDEENQCHQKKRLQSRGVSSQAQGSAGNSSVAAEDETGYRSFHDLFPANYITCVNLFIFPTKVLNILGVGVQEIKELKKRYFDAMEVLDKMLELESRYTYESNGQRPKIDGEIEIPKAPQFGLDEDDNYHDTTPLTNAQSKQGGKEGYITTDTPLPLLVAARTGILEMVKRIHKKCRVAIQDVDFEEKNVLMLAAQRRHTAVFDYLFNDAKLPEYMFRQFDKDGNSILHHAAKLTELQSWRIPGAALQMQWEIKWYKHVERLLSTQNISLPNKEGETPKTIFSVTHKELKKAGSEWLIKTSESCSVVAALVAAVAFATSSNVPGGVDQNKGNPLRQHENAFDVFAIASLLALCLSVMALVFFLAIITSRFEEYDFRRNLPRKLLAGLSSLFASIAAIMLSFCSGHTFILREELKVAAIPIYAFATIPVAVAQLPLYFDLLWAACRKVPLRSDKVFSY